MFWRGPHDPHDSSRGSPGGCAKLFGWQRRERELRGSCCDSRGVLRFVRAMGASAASTVVWMLPIGSWPNPSAPASIAIGAVIGGCIGETIAWRRRYDADKTTRVAMKGSYYGTIFTLIAYLGTNLFETIFP